MSKLACLFVLFATAAHAADVETRFVKGMQVSRIPFGDAAVRTIFAPDGKSFYVLETKGTLRRISVPELQEIKSNQLTQHNATSLTMYKGGLAAVLQLEQTVVTIDPATLAIVNRIKIPNVERISSSPVLDVAFTTGGSPGAGLFRISGVNLKTGKVAFSSDGRPLRALAKTVKRPKSSFRAIEGFALAEVTPDGKYLFGLGAGALNRYRINGTRLTWEEHGHRVAASNPRKLEFSLDGKLVCVPCGGGNRAAHNHPAVNYGTYIYDVKDQQSPQVSIVTGAYPTAVAFDPVTKNIYAQNFDVQLIVLNSNGVKQAEYKFVSKKPKSEEVKEIVPHPKGGRLLIRTEKSIYWCEFR